MEITKEEFLQWKESPVTKAVFEVIDNRIEDAKEVLAVTAGEDCKKDGILVGMIRAFRELQEINYDDN